MKIRVLYLLIFSSVGEAHMSLWYPPALGGTRKANPLTSHVDSQLNFPLGCCDSAGAPTLPSPGDCRGHLDLLNTEEGKPQVAWEAGQRAYFQLSDHTYTLDAPGDTHYGGSCQAGFSTDKGLTWKVAASYHGNCPHRHEDGIQTFHFTVPTSMPTGPALFAWIWLNREHESFMNCASVWISGGCGNHTQSRTVYSSAVQSAPGARPTDRYQKGSGQNSVSSGHKKLTSTLDTYWSTASPTRSHWERIRHNHRRKHFKYYYIRAVNKHETPQHHGIPVKKRVAQPCDWASAPRMITSYYTTDADCAANAKSNNVDSDNFEIGWSDACGVVAGDGEYPIKDINCD
jgi:hypothetical protein